MSGNWQEQMAQGNFNYCPVVSSGNGLIGEHCEANGQSPDDDWRKCECALPSTDTCNIWALEIVTNYNMHFLQTLQSLAGVQSTYWKNTHWNTEKTQDLKADWKSSDINDHLMIYICVCKCACVDSNWGEWFSGLIYSEGQWKWQWNILRDTTITQSNGNNLPSITRADGRSATKRVNSERGVIAQIEPQQLNILQSTHTLTQSQLKLLKTKLEMLCSSWINSSELPEKPASNDCTFIC